MARRSSTTMHGLLGLLALRPRWRAYDLAQEVRRNLRFFWPRAESRVYEEARHLVELGLAESSREFAGRRGRTVYWITPHGRAHLAEWLRTPPAPTALECDALLRVLLGTLTGRGELEAATARVRADAQVLYDVARVVGDEYLQGRAPFQDQVAVRGFVFDFLMSYAHTLRGWADRTDAALADWDDVPAEERAARGVALIARCHAGIPADSEPPASRG